MKRYEDADATSAIDDGMDYFVCFQCLSVDDYARMAGGVVNLDASGFIPPSERVVFTNTDRVLLA